MKIPSAKRLQDCYLLTQEMWLRIYNYQEGKCAICGKPLDRLNKKGNPVPMHTDHRHASGLICGILCFRCNAALGEIMTLEFVRKVLAYLENPPAVLALGRAHYGLPGRTGTKTQRKLLKKLKSGVVLTKPLMEDQNGV